MRKSDILVIGDTALDILLKLDRRSDLYEDLIFRDVQLQVGGIATNVALQISKLGHRVRFCTIVGHDPFSKYIVEELEKVELELHVKLVEGRATRNVIIVHPTGERTIFSNVGVHIELSPSHCDIEIARNTRFLFIPAFPAFWPIIDKFKGTNTKIACDLGFATTVSELGEFCRHIGPKIDLAFLSGSRFHVKEMHEMHEFLLTVGCEVVFTTLGSEGVQVMTKNQQTTLPPFNVTAINTTGAGDSFIAGVLVGLSEERSFVESAELGQAVAAARISRVTIPTMNDLSPFILGKYNSESHS